MKNAIHYIEYVAIRLMGFLINLMPFPVALTLANPIGIGLFYILGKQRNKALDNLRRAFGNEKSEEDIIKIAKGSFIFLVEFAMEWLRLPEMAKHPDQYFSVNHAEKVHAALKQKKGAIFLVSHNSNQEIMAVITGCLIARPINAEVFAVARPIKNHYLYRYILKVRGIFGTKCIDKKGAVRETFKQLKRNAIVAVLIDQRVSEGQTAAFFGRLAVTTSLPAMAAIRNGVPVFFVSLARASGPKFIFDIQGPLEIQTTNDFEADIRSATQQFNDLIEAKIRKEPAHWLWMHNRWRMPGEAK